MATRSYDITYKYVLEGRQPSRYIIEEESGIWYSWNCKTHKDEFSGASAATVIQSSLNALTAGRLGREKVLVKGDCTTDGALIVSGLTELEFQGSYTYTGAGVALTVGGSATECQFPIIRSLQLFGTSSGAGGILLSHVTYGSLHDVTVKGFTKAGAYGICYDGDTINDVICNSAYNLRTTNNDIGIKLSGKANQNTFFGGVYSNNRIGIYTYKDASQPDSNHFYSPDIESNSEYGIDDNGDYLKVLNAWFDNNTIKDIRAGNQNISRWAEISSRYYTRPSYVFGAQTCRSAKITNAVGLNILDLPYQSIHSGDTAEVVAFPANYTLGGANQYIVSISAEWDAQEYISACGATGFTITFANPAATKHMWIKVMIVG